ncbi:hypothetical protein [Bacteroides sp. 519]|uniref:hypothetical protein n=1 Tax=Bacteroides sp. 519 TaxID=2302937 RepID=UPI0013CFAD54|nr:hypothetical protein [Bacteroides sp. 519]
MKKMKKNREEEKNYLSPHLEVVEVNVEEGFAASAAIEGELNDFTTNNFGRDGSMTNY